MAKEEGIKQNPNDLITHTVNLNQNANMNVLKCIWKSVVRYENKLGDFFGVIHYLTQDETWFQCTGQCFLTI